MAKMNPQIDAYIEKSADFAKPILTHLRELVHTACPDVEEKMKWSMPHFDYKGAMMCSMAAFKQHAVFSFWKGSLIKDNAKIFTSDPTAAMGQMGQIKSVNDLPKDEILISYIREAVRLNEENVKLPTPVRKHEKKELVEPDYFIAALAENSAARQTYTNFSPSNKRDYLEWIVGAKTEETRNKRLSDAIEWMAEGKTRHWKYLKK